MSYLKTLRSYCNAYYILNTLVCASYLVMKTVHPICEWFFSEGEKCELSWRDSEVLMFVTILLAIKTSTKWKKDVNKDFIGMAFAFFKAVNLVLFLRSDWRLFIIYFVICLIFFIALPEPLYTGPDNVQLFNGIALQDELKENPNVTWLIEFYTVWSPPCKKLAEPFAEISLKYKNDYLKFGKMDLGRNPVMAKKYSIDDSITSRQLPTLILFTNGREAIRRPVKALGRDGKVVPFILTQENITTAFDLKSCHEAAKTKIERDEKKAKKEEKKMQ